MERRILRRHILGYSVCLCPIKKDVSLIWVNIHDVFSIYIYPLHVSIRNETVSTKIYDKWDAMNLV